MTERTIHTSPPGDLQYADDLVTAIEEGLEAARTADDEQAEPSVFYFIQDQDGRGAQKVEVIEDTLSDGNKAYTLRITFDF